MPSRWIYVWGFSGFFRFNSAFFTRPSFNEPGECGHGEATGELALAPRAARFEAGDLGAAGGGARAAPGAAAHRAAAPGGAARGASEALQGLGGTGVWGFGGLGSLGLDSFGVGEVGDGAWIFLLDKK